MLSLEEELEQLRPTLGDARADALIARERREVFSVYPELRIAAWAGAMLLATAAGIVLQKNLDRIGPLALAVLIGLAAGGCYAWVRWRRRSATIADDYVLLLGALLVSADLAFIEQQFHLLDHHWPRHFLILAIVHGVGAYVYKSRTLLSLSIAALAAWMGIERRTVFDSLEDDFAPRAFMTAGLLIAWRQLHVILSREDGEGSSPFLRVFEHFAANLALCGALTLATDAGYLLTIALAALVMAWGFMKRSEPFVLYAFIYAVIAVDALLLHHFEGHETAIILTSSVIAIAALIAIDKRFRERRG